MDYFISEIFYSIQGEGLLQGIPMVFIRLAGCNLRCPFCDTKYAWEKGNNKKDVGEIINEVKKFRCKKVCITGGEPYLQDLKILVSSLKKLNFWISIETNGTIWQEIEVDWITVSPKIEGRNYHKDGFDRKFLEVANEFKYVITGEEIFEFISRDIKCPVILQPVDNDLKIAEKIIKFLKKERKENFYLRLQLHKILKIP
ncbi:7-carboxy-7-deazaguanine synthase QueE [bacterium]|nr:7-carboxy-7-deazaguanine synthase QueE [bacterium]